MKNKKYHTVEIIPKSNIKIDIPNTQIHDRSSSWLGTAGSSIRTGEVKLVVWAQTSIS